LPDAASQRHKRRKLQDLHSIKRSSAQLQLSKVFGLVKGKGHTVHFNIAPTMKEPHCRSAQVAMARVVEGFQSFTCTPTRSSTNRMKHTFAFPAEADLHLPTLERWKAELDGLSTTKLSKQFAMHDRHLTAVTTISCSSLQCRLYRRGVTRACFS